MFVPSASDSVDKDDEMMPNSCDSQEDIPMLPTEDPFANGQSDDIEETPFQSHFIKTETNYQEDNYDEMYGY